MNLGKSIRVACAQKDIKGKDLAKILGVSEATISTMLNKPTGKEKSLTALAEVFEMPVSEFIALGE